jgi:hypothetical protein
VRCQHERRRRRNASVLGVDIAAGLPRQPENGGVKPPLRARFFDPSLLQERGKLSFTVFPVKSRPWNSEATGLLRELCVEASEREDTEKIRFWFGAQGGAAAARIRIDRA